MLGSQSLVLATAMAVSTTAIILAFSRHNRSDPPPPPPPKQQPLRSCLSTPESKKRRAKKKVKFADNVVKDNKQRSERSCRSEIGGEDGMMMMPPNRIALYNGILKDRSQQRLLLGCSH